MNKNKEILIIILNYKTYEMTLDLIKQLNSLNTNIFDIYVIDNCSPNESATVLKEKSKEYNYIFYKNNINSGYASGNNIGIRYAIENNYKYSLILNNDLNIIDNEFIEKLISKANQDESIACIGPKIIDLDGNITPPYIERPTFYGLTLGMLGEKNRRKKMIDCERQVYRIFGCCMLVRNSSMKLVNCMDEKTFLYCEEEILAEKLLKYNLFSYYYPNAKIIHMESSTVKKEKGKRTLKRMRPLLDSMEIYLGQYRGFNKLQIWMCKIIRIMIILLRG